MLTTEDIAAANARAAERLATTPHATAARYDRRTDRIIDIAAKEKTWSLGIVKRQQTSNNAQF